jgi:hypothetical protein
MNDYVDSKKTLDKVRDEYGCKGEMIFRTALQYVVEYGQCKFNNDEWVTSQLMLVDGKHDEAEAEGKFLFIGREFEKAIIECAKEIAKINPYDLLVYIQKEVWLSHEGGIDYERAVELLKGCISNIEQWNDCQCDLTLHELEDIGFDDDEIEELGFGYVLSVREEEEDD